MTLHGRARAKAGPAAGKAKQPHILFILADDMGYADLSCYGAQGYRTPVLDELAQQGARLDQAYANAAICSPTRTALLTGRYQGHFKAGLAEPNIRFAPGQEVPLDTPTVASMLRDAGYRTALVGKWHVCKIPEFGPTHYGYDHFFGIAAGAADYFTHNLGPGFNSPDAGLHDGDKPVSRDGYLTDILADEAIRQIRAKSDKPLFLSLHFNSPHWPWEGPEDVDHHRSVSKMNDPTGGSLETYAKMMMSMDANIGRVLAALDEMGMAEDTIVVFTSDNGGERYSNTWPCVGYKGELMEGGIRVPLIMRWPGRIAPGTRSDQVMISMDTVPTFLAAAGAPVPDNLEGINLLPQLVDGAPPVKRTLFWRMKASGQAAVRDGDWKYLRIGNKERLFNVRKDPRERAEQQTLQPAIMADLKQRWEAWNATQLPYPDRSPSEGAFNIYIDRYRAPVSAGGDNAE
ncbi:MAG: sulfatase-like hydrolase/transferase [Sphingomonas sp.]|nr:sulfatase-like hydrolase/transferase [Sphingomonas sp.]